MKTMLNVILLAGALMLADPSHAQRLEGPLETPLEHSSWAGRTLRPLVHPEGQPKGRALLLWVRDSVLPKMGLKIRGTSLSDPRS